MEQAEQLPTLPVEVQQVIFCEMMAHETTQKGLIKIQRLNKAWRTFGRQIGNISSF